MNGASPGRDSHKMLKNLRDVDEKVQEFIKNSPAAHKRESSISEIPVNDEQHKEAPNFSSALASNDNLNLRVIPLVVKREELKLPPIMP